MLLFLLVYCLFMYPYIETVGLALCVYACKCGFIVDWVCKAEFTETIVNKLLGFAQGLWGGNSIFRSPDFPWRGCSRTVCTVLQFFSWLTSVTCWLDSSASLLGASLAVSYLFLKQLCPYAPVFKIKCLRNYNSSLHGITRSKRHSRTEWNQCLQKSINCFTFL